MADLPARCPHCGKQLEKVRQSPDSMLNADQFDAVRAGDYFCPFCPSNHRGNTDLCYFWERELRELP